MFFWSVMLALGYFIAPLIGFLLWMRRVWGFRSGWLRAFATAVIIITIVSSLNASSLNSQLVPSYNVYWLALLGLALALPYFLPEAADAVPYHLATQALLLGMSLALHLWYCYLTERLLFDNQFSYYAAPGLSLCFLLSLIFVARQKNRWLRLGIIGLALLLGLALQPLSYRLAVP